MATISIRIIEKFKIKEIYWIKTVIQFKFFLLSIIWIDQIIF